MRLPLKAMQLAAIQVPPDEAWYHSRLLNFTEDRELVVGAPTREGQVLQVDPGQLVRVELNFPDGIRRFESTVRRTDASRPALHIEWPREATRIQRRDNVRVGIRVPASIVLPPTEEQPSRAINGITLDVSAGGARLNLPEAIPDQTVIQLELTLPGAFGIDCYARVLRSGERKEGPTVSYWNAVEFTEISELYRREITKFVFDVQRDQLRRV